MSGSRESREFGAFLKELRARYGRSVGRQVTQAQFAEILSTSDRSLRRYETGEALPSRDWVVLTDAQLAKLECFEPDVLTTAYAEIVGEVGPDWTVPDDAGSTEDEPSETEAASSALGAPGPDAGSARPADGPSEDWSERTAEGHGPPDETDDDDGGDGQTDPETRAAMRAFLQRAEVRLSTVHRVAGSFLGGAGLLLLLPLFLRDGFPTMYTALMDTWAAGGDHWAVGLVALVGATSIALPLLAMWLLLEDLIGFYFTGHTFESHAGDVLSDDERAHRVFHPRFILYGLALPEDEVSVGGRRALDAGRRATTTKRAVIPDDPEWRLRMDQRIRAIWPDEPYPPQGAANDDDRRRFLSRMAGSWDRPIAEEVAKTEATLVRHVLNIRIVVLRYTKALLVMLSAAVVTLLVTGVASYGMKSSGGEGLAPVDLLRIAGLYALWAPLAAAAVTAPLRWIYKRNQGVGKIDDAYRDERMTQYENLGVVTCACAFVLAVVAMLLETSSVDGGGVVVGIVLVVAAVVWTRVFGGWKGGAKRAIRSIGFTLKGQQP